MKTVFIAGVEGAGQGRVARMVALGSVDIGNTTVIIGAKDMPVRTRLYTLKEGERLAPMRTHVLVLDEVSDTFRREIVGAFQRHDEPWLLKSLGVVATPSIVLVVTKDVEPKPKAAAKPKTPRNPR